MTRDEISSEYRKTFITNITVYHPLFSVLPTCFSCCCFKRTLRLPIAVNVAMKRQMLLKTTWLCLKSTWRVLNNSLTTSSTSTPRLTPHCRELRMFHARMQSVQQMTTRLQQKEASLTFDMMRLTWNMCTFARHATPFGRQMTKIEVEKIEMFKSFC